VKLPRSPASPNDELEPSSPDEPLEAPLDAPLLPPPEVGSTKPLPLFSLAPHPPNAEAASVTSAEEKQKAAADRVRVRKTSVRMAVPLTVHHTSARSQIPPHS